MKRSLIIPIHLLLWIFLYAVMFVTCSIFISTSNAQWVLSGRMVSTVTLMLLPVVMVPFYIFYFLYPLLLVKKTLWYIVGLAVVLIMPLIYLKLDSQPITKVMYHNTFLLLGFFALLGFLFRSFLNGLTDRQLRNELQRKQLQSELTYLKAQINPHFLFNTLNNIDSLIDGNPKLASQSLINLSDIMRYMIYESIENLVPLQKELDYLTKVISLYKLRYKAEKLIAFRISGEAAHYNIPPLLLLPIIENTFKHQSAKYSNDPIVITIIIEQGMLILTCSNPFDEFAEKTNSGFGLETLRRRLDLLFPAKHDFEVVAVPPIFKVSLKIPLV